MFRWDLQSGETQELQWMGPVSGHCLRQVDSMEISLEER